MEDEVGPSGSTAGAGFGFWAAVAVFGAAVRLVAGFAAVVAAFAAGFAVAVRRLAAGFAAGTSVGPWLEEKLAIGGATMRIITMRTGAGLANGLRTLGCGVTEFEGGFDATLLGGNARFEFTAYNKHVEDFIIAPPLAQLHCRPYTELLELLLRRLHVWEKQLKETGRQAACRKSAPRRARAHRRW